MGLQLACSLAACTLHALVTTGSVIEESVAAGSATVVQEAYLKASNTETLDWFGSTVAVDGDTIAITAAGEDSSSGDQADNSADSGGAVYVFVRQGGIWVQQAYLKPATIDAGDGFGGFGTALALSGDRLVVGAPAEDSAAAGVNGDASDNSAARSGAAYVFVRNGGVWMQEAYLKASNAEASDEFGYSAAISGDTIVIGASGEDSSSTGVNGDEANNDRDDSGAAYVFVRDGGSWSQQAYLKASNCDWGDRFGGAVAISGETVLVGADHEDSRTGDPADNSASGSGAAYVFVRTGTTWQEQAYLKSVPSPPSASFSSSLSLDGDRAVIGSTYHYGIPAASASGVAFVFARTGTEWLQETRLVASNADGGDHFGRTVSISGDTIVVGAWRERSAATGVDGDQGDNSLFDVGAAYVFVRRDWFGWSQRSYLKASNAESRDGFAISVAVSGRTIVVGAADESSAAVGVGGDQADNGASRSGAAYVFDVEGIGPTTASFCDASDGVLALCPCGNPGGPDSGCDNAQGTGGVSLAVLGQATGSGVATLVGTGFPPEQRPLSIALRSAGVDLWVPVAFGDGVRCIGVNGLVRLAPTLASAGTASHVLGHGAMDGTGLFYYQLLYRNTPSTFCDASMPFNLSNGALLAW